MLLSSLALSLLDSRRSLGLNNVNIIRFIILNFVSELDAMLAPPNPGSLRHRSIDLLQVELQLQALFVDVGNHVRWLDKRHGEGGPGLEFGRSTLELDLNHGIERAESGFVRERLDDKFLLLQHVRVMHLGVGL